MALLQADDVERALSYFLRSRAEQASAKNTGNAAICLSRLRVGLTMSAVFFPAFGPRFTHENTGVNPRCEPARPTAVGCAPITHLLQGERAFAPFVLWSPQVSLGYEL